MNGCISTKACVDFLIGLPQSVVGFVVYGSTSGQKVQASMFSTVA